MQVIKRDNSKQPISFDKIVIRINNLISMEPQLKNVNSILIAQKVIAGVYDNILTSQLDELAADAAIFMSTTHYDYATLASRIAVSNLHKQTSSNYKEVIGVLEPILSEECIDIIYDNIDVIQNAFDYTLDYQYDYFGFKTLCKSYLFKMNNVIVERPQHLLMRVAVGIHKNNIDMILKSYYLMSHQYFTHATPTLFNSCTKKPQLASCFLMTMIDDSVEGIYDTLKNTALISKHAGGVGISIHNIRAKGSSIKSNGGESGGIVPMLRTFNDCALHINQASKRKGAFAIYLEPHHADIVDFLELKKNNGKEELRCRDLFYALWISDLFMNRVKNNESWSLFCPDECPGLDSVYGDDYKLLYEKYELEGKARKVMKAQTLWNHIVVAQIETGTPYMLYKDTINSHNNQSNLGTLKSSNLCVSGDTLIMTDKGHLPIKTLENESVNVWNGDEWSNTIVRKTGENKELLNVTLSNGVSIKCTPYHKFPVVTNKRTKEYNIVDASELKENDPLLKYNLPEAISFEKKELKNPYTQGFFAGDGTYSYNKDKKTPIIYLYGEKKELLSYITYRKMTEAKDDSKRLNIYLNNEDLNDKFYVPMDEHIDIKLKWFEGYCDADGTIVRNKNSDSLQVGSIEFDFLLKVKLMLQLLGIDSKVTKHQDERMIFMPDHKDGSKEYTGKTIFRLMLGQNDLCKLLQLGFLPKILKINTIEFNINCSKYIKIVKVEALEEKEDTFCFTEPKRNFGMFNGVLLKNCSEIVEYTAPDEISVCTLSSIGLPAFVSDGIFDHQKLYDVCYHVTLNLNQIIDVNYYPLKETNYSNFKNRPIGIGVQGLADVFIMLRYPYDSAEAKQLNQEIFETMYFAAATASCDLAKQYGSYSSFQGSPASKGILTPDLWNHTPTNRWNFNKLRLNILSYGLRNSLLIALMPTASTSSILNNTECFEPLTSNIYSRRVMAGEFIILNKFLIKDLIELGLWNEYMKNEIIKNHGSVQKINTIPTNIKLLYRTVWELSMRDLIDMSADRNPFVCQSQSFNAYIAHPNKAKLTSMHFYAWSKGLKTGMYYLRTQSAAEAIAVTINTINNNEIVCTNEEGCIVCGS